MIRSLKNTLRKVLFSAGIDITKNQQYDRQTLAIMKKVLKKDSGCIDVGCHKGEVMDEILKIAPSGNHIGFEPIPEYYDFLIKKYHSMPNVHIYKNALSDTNEISTFNWVKNAPAYSGIKQREYAIKNPQIEKIEVELKKLDEIGKDFSKTDLIKIDVEGAEMKVLKGGINFIKHHRPVIIFECGLGAADFYGVQPEEVFIFFDSIKYQLNTLKGFLNNDAGLTKERFTHIYQQKTDYYFAASTLAS